VSTVQYRYKTLTGNECPVSSIPLLHPLHIFYDEPQSPLLSRLTPRCLTPTCSVTTALGCMTLSSGLTAALTSFAVSAYPNVCTIFALLPFPASLHIFPSSCLYHASAHIILNLADHHADHHPTTPRPPPTESRIVRSPQKCSYIPHNRIPLAFVTANVLVMVFARSTQSM